MRLSPFGPLDAWLAPPPAADRVAWLARHSYAHRGLHDGMGGEDIAAPLLENSMPAFAAAAEQGFGIECDVQLTRDGRAVVFHDATLERLTTARGRIAAQDLARLTEIRLNGENGTIPELAEMLAALGGKVPVLIEIKSDDDRVAPLCMAVRRAIEGKGKHIAVMGFNPMVGAWFRRHAPHVVRGLVVTEEGNRGWRGRLRRHLSLWTATPDFLAYDIRDLPSDFAGAQRARGLPLLSWTVRDAAQHALVDAHADAPIFERRREA